MLQHKFRPQSGFFSALVHQPWVSRFASCINRNFRFYNDFAISVHGHKMYTNSLDRLCALLLWKQNILESIESKILLSQVSNGAVALDIGANIGYFTLQLASIVGPQGKIYSFEPDPSNFRLLCKNIQCNSYKNVIAINKAVSLSTGTTKLFRSEGHSGDHRLYDSKDGRPSVDVEQISVDEFLKDEPVSFIKMDIQGGEYNALLGMQKTVEHNEAVILMEYMPTLLRKNGIAPKLLLKTIEEMGLKIHLIDEKMRALIYLTRDQLPEVSERNYQYLNLLLSHKIIVMTF